MFCRNCGRELIGSPEICLGCGAKPLAGRSFCHACGAETNALAEICINCGARLKVAVVERISPKSRLATTLLAFFLGQFGAHRFYTGKIATAVVMLVLTLVGWATVWLLIGLAFIIPVGIWAFVDFIVAVTGYARDAEGRRIVTW
jgi:TM2 domain-containing membrane protein YozV